MPNDFIIDISSDSRSQKLDIPKKWLECRGLERRLGEGAVCDSAVLSRFLKIWGRDDKRRWGQELLWVNGGSQGDIPRGTVRKLNEGIYLEEFSGLTVRVSRTGLKSSGSGFHS